MKTTIKKVDLAESVKNALATTKSAGMEAVETVFTEIAKALAEGNTNALFRTWHFFFFGIKKRHLEKCHLPFVKLIQE